MQRVWLVTGASSGFGRAFSEHALAVGDSVVAGARDVSKLESLQASNPQRVLTVTMDVNDPGQVRSAVTQTVERFGRVDILVNNAGYGIVGAVEETPDQELRAQMETNFFGAAAVIREVLPMLRRQRGGAIVNISSMGGQLSFAGFGAYSASKFALEGLSEALAAEVKPFGIKVLIVEPGAFRTAFAGNALKQMPENPAYAESSGQTRRFARAMNASQPGDPRKAAAAVDHALRSESTPLRLQLGEDAVQAVEAHSKALLDDLELWRSVGLNTALDPA